MKSLLTLAFAILAVMSSTVSGQTGKITDLNFMQSIMMGIKFFSADEGYVNGATSNGMPFIYKVSNNGQNQDSIDYSTNAMMTMAMAMNSSTSGVTTGLAFLVPSDAYYSAKEGTWVPSTSNFSMEVSQSVQTVANVKGGFISAGQYNANQGVAVSTDGGNTFKPFNVKDLSTQPRYAAAPSLSTLYLTGGTWPSSGLKKGHFALTSKHSIPHPRADAINSMRRTEFPRLNTGSSVANCSQPDNSYFGALFTSKDGGNSWSCVYQTTDLYFNDIRCLNEKVCYAVGEGPSVARVYSTQDGGNTWSVVLEQEGADMMTLDIVNGKNLYVAGGIGNKGTVFFSFDAGKTWSTAEYPGYQFLGISMVSETKGFLVGANVFQVMGLLRFDITNTKTQDAPIISA